jgi:hypothetical protein
MEFEGSAPKSKLSGVIPIPVPVGELRKNSQNQEGNRQNLEPNQVYNLTYLRDDSVIAMKRNSHSIWGTDWASFVFVSYLSLILHGIGRYVAGSTVNQDELTSNFKRFVVQYNRSYVNNPEEYQYRMSVFQVFKPKIIDE